MSEGDTGGQVAVTGRAALPTIIYNPEQIELLKRTVCKGATNDELALFIHVAKRTGLDPFARQVHAVKRWDQASGTEVMAIQTGIDGYRLIAERTGQYAPGREPTFGYDEKGALVTATAYVKKLAAGEWHEVAATAHFSEYAAKKKDGSVTNMWATKPHIMLAKCAEALALRRAFPADLSGVYTHEEMDQAGPIQTDTATAPKKAAPERPKPTAGDQEGTLVVSGVVEDVQIQKSKPDAKKPWTRYGIKLGGEYFGTFDKDLGEIAVSAKENSASIRLTYKVRQDGDKTYKDAVTIEPATKEAASA